MARPKATDTLSISELQNLIAQRKDRLLELRRERTKVARRLSQLDRELEILSGQGGRGGGIRPRNEKNLVDLIEEVMAKSAKPMGVGEVTDAVTEAGYRSSSANFKGIVNQTLIKDKRFASPSRGVYQLRK